ncbi:MAG TPA: CpaF family protein [Planctomycetota bacterium]|nr:CpaF family protein [Planctomycetota bacterium]
MGLRDLLKKSQERQNVVPARLAAAATDPVRAVFKQQSDEGKATGLPDAYSAIKHRLHQRILKEVDVTRFDPDRDRDAFRSAVNAIIQETLAESRAPLTKDEKERLIEDVLSEAVGLGPLGELVDDAAISDILVNGPYKVYIERFGHLELTNIKFRDNEHLMRLIERIVARVGRHIDQHAPMVDARLPDGSRVNAIIPPLSLAGPILSIRRFGNRRYGAEDLAKFGTLTPQMIEIFESLVHTRHNVLISGGTGTGKTTFLNVLSSFIAPKERIITIEDAAELRLAQDHVVSLESRPPNIEGHGRVAIRDLVINSLRMRPDRIIVGEVRGGEAFDMLQAMSTGHDGSMTTIHSNTSRDALKRLESMVLLAGFDIPNQAIREFIASAINVLVHLERFPDGTRKVVSVSEIVGIEKGTILIQDIFLFQRQEVHEGKVVGRHVSTGVRPQFMQRCELHGYKFDPALYQRGHAV